MKWLMLIPYTGLWLLLAFVGLWSTKPASLTIIPSTGISQSADSQTPLSGWKVCDDFGTGSVSGVPGVFQRFGLCNGKEWKAWTYLLAAGKSALEEGVACIRVGEANYRCGEMGLSFRQYQLMHFSTSKPAAGNPPVKPVSLSPYRQASISAHSTAGLLTSPTGAQSTGSAAKGYLLYSLGIWTTVTLVGFGLTLHARRTRTPL